MYRSFAYMMLNTPDVAEKLRTAAEQCTGGAIHVVIRPMDAQDPSGHRSLEELAKFSNVEFK